MLGGSSIDISTWPSMVAGGGNAHEVLGGRALSGGYLYFQAASLASANDDAADAGDAENLVLFRRPLTGNSEELVVHPPGQPALITGIAAHGGAAFFALDHGCQDNAVYKVDETSTDVTPLVPCDSDESFGGLDSLRDFVGYQGSHLRGRRV